ncbi:hypothetical protein BDP81DRAFT_205749 [Colletotrichum phormii]|uniref:Uncharacterized protein n=1 Tax=Colletotrichum phormii TaxID=359342 RepID=A0AAI9ZXB8_9PEZI|nr:uncharacterized protein BDP81DRAFT_205749 [Colletotrichum phormii]KAK1638297.1 hypothetical protein BDP81DRAFT_205749 [Colletotrichum phormii]
MGTGPQTNNLAGQPMSGLYSVLRRMQMQIKGLAESGVCCQRKPEDGAAVHTTGRHYKVSRSRELNILQPPGLTSLESLTDERIRTSYNMSETLGLCSSMIGSVISGLPDPHSTEACPSGSGIFWKRDSGRTWKSWRAQQQLSKSNRLQRP